MNFFGVWESAFVMFSGLFFYLFLTPFMLGVHDFLISNPFSTIVNVSNVPRGGVQVLFGNQKQQSPPLGSELT
jgi:hypothetical protein